MNAPYTFLIRDVFPTAIVIIDRFPFSSISDALAQSNTYQAHEPL
ncbi:MAG: hypothetical protein IKV95_09680 [Brochothrix sp.]|nr:hypothetical protein [Brochothrix sp.]